MPAGNRNLPLADRPRRFRAPSRADRLVDVSSDIILQDFKQLPRLLSAEIGASGIALAGEAEIGTIEGEIDVFGKAPDRAERFGQRRPALEHKGRPVFTRNRKETLQGPAYPKVFLENGVRKTLRRACLTEERCAIACRPESDLIHRLAKVPQRRLSSKSVASMREP